MLITQMHKLLSLVEHALTPVILYNDVQHTSPSSLPHETLPGIIAQLDICKNIILSRDQVLELQNLAKVQFDNLANHAFVQQSPEGMYTQGLKNDFLDKLKENITAQINEAVQQKAKNLVKAEPSIEVQLRRLQRMIENNLIKENHSIKELLKSHLGENIENLQDLRPENFEKIQRSMIEAFKDEGKNSEIIKCLTKLFESQHDGTLLNKTQELKSALKARITVLLINIEDQIGKLEGSTQWDNFIESVTQIKNSSNDSENKEYDIATYMKDVRTLIEAYPKDLLSQQDSASYEIADAIEKMLTSEEEEEENDMGIQKLFEKYRQDLREAEDPREYATLIESTNGADVTKSPIYQVASALEEIPSLTTEICYRRPALVQQATVQAPQKNSSKLSTGAVGKIRANACDKPSKDERIAINMFLKTREKMYQSNVVAIQLKNSAQQRVFNTALEQLQTWAAADPIPPALSQAVGSIEELKYVVKALSEIRKDPVQNSSSVTFYH